MDSSQCYLLIWYELSTVNDEEIKIIWSYQNLSLSSHHSRINWAISSLSPAPTVKVVKVGKNQQLFHLIADGEFPILFQT